VAAASSLVSLDAVRELCAAKALLCALVLHRCISQ
jgi:hypothetical protein